MSPIQRLLSKHKVSIALCLSFLCGLSYLAHKDATRQIPSLERMVPMRDGCRLATDVFLPEGPGPWPVVLERTRYERQLSDLQKRILKDGYAVVIQNTRGRYQSEGVDRMFRTDGNGLLKDGYDTCAWIVSQTWCNGKIGTYGNSARGITQCLLATSAPPGLVCQVIGFAPGDFFSDWAYPGGAKSGIWRKFLESQEATWLLDESREHFQRDEWWEAFNFVESAPLVRYPTLHITGCFDLWVNGTIKRFQAWQNHGGHGARGRQWLLIGPWAHGVSQGNIGAYEFDDAGVSKHDEMVMAFFDHWLKGKSMSLEDGPHITYWELAPKDRYRMGGWKVAQKLPEAEEWQLYLSSEHTLSPSPPSKVVCVSFEYDPRKPWITRGGATIYSQEGPQDLADELQKQHHVLLLSSVLTDAVHMTGSARASLHVGVDAPSYDLVGILIDVWPDGRHFIISDGIQSVNRLSSVSAVRPLNDNHVEVLISMGWISYVFLPGHRIGLAITGGSYPKFELNPQNGDFFYTEVNARPAHFNIYSDNIRMSRLLLYLVEN